MYIFVILKSCKVSLFILQEGLPDGFDPSRWQCQCSDTETLVVRYICYIRFLRLKVNMMKQILTFVVSTDGVFHQWSFYFLRCLILPMKCSFKFLIDSHCASNQWYYVSGIWLTGSRKFSGFLFKYVFWPNYIQYDDFVND